MRYHVVLKPTLVRDEAAIVDTDGVTYKEIVAGVTEGDMIPVIQAVSEITGSEDQVTGLLAYAAAIKAGEDTSSVEEAIEDLGS